MYEDPQRLDRFIGKINNPDFLGINRMTYNQFKQLLIRINGIVLGLPKSTRGITNQNIEISNPTTEYIHDIPPDPRDKDDLLRLLFNSAQKLSDKRDVGLLIFLGLQSIHLFSDGNGKTGRAIYNFLTNNRPITTNRFEFEKQHIKPPPEVINKIYELIVPEILGSDFFSKYRNIRSIMSNNSLPRFNPDAPDSLESRVSQILRETGPRTISNAVHFRDLVIAQYLKQKGQLNVGQPGYTPSLFNKYSQEQEKEIFFLKIPNLNPTDFELLIEIHRKLKRLVIEKLIDVISNPDKYLIQKKPLKNEFFA